MSDENYLSNKDVIINLMKRMDELEESLSETNRIIIKYNGLREDLEEVEIELEDTKECVTELETEKQQEDKVQKVMRKYGSWVFGLLMFILYLYEIGIFEVLI